MFNNSIIFFIPIVAVSEITIKFSLLSILGLGLIKRVLRPFFFTLIKFLKLFLH